MIGEFDTVALTRPVAQHGVEAGDIGTVVMVHPDEIAHARLVVV